ncbi:hypothetical protein BsWGS_25047 [Bradybaena similaris]
MEEGERAHTEGGTTSTCTSPPTSPTSNGKPGGRGEKVTSPTERGRAGGADGFAGIAAKMLGAKVKGQGGQKPGKSGGRNHKQNGCDDDLPLGSEAHSLGPNHATDYSSKYAPTEDERSAWSRTISPGIMGWQSFSSDVSNHTSASSASLEQLLNDRQMDPEEMLLNLGFGAEPRSLMPTLARVPDRFLNHPSRAYGIEPPGLSDEQEDMASDNTDTTMPVPDKVLVPAATAAVTAHPKRRTDIWALARTLSMLRMKSAATRGHVSPSSNCSGAKPQPGYPMSILHPANQKYLASRGFYEKQGWPKGSFAEPEEDIASVAQDKVQAIKNAESRRKIFQKTKSRRNWSMCDSEENDQLMGGGEWMTKSVDDSRSHDDNGGQDDSLGHGTYFSTTESSTDSLDTPNLETERAFENIRREFHESRRREYSSSDDLFVPVRRKRLSSEVTDINENMLSEHGFNFLNTQGSSTNYFVSPASSRQTTVEKAPTISDQALSVMDDVDGENKHIDTDGSPHVQGHSQSQGLVNKSVHVGHTRDDGIGDVRIIISSSDSNSGQRRPHFLSDEDQPNVKSATLMVENVQTASSDSGSSGSATVVGGTHLMLASHEAELRRLSESEHSVTDKDSISRSNSPYGFSHSSARRVTSSSCQTTDTDFIMAAAVAASHQVNVNTQTTNHRMQLHLHIKGPGAPDLAPDSKKRDYAFLEQSPKVQLSTLPATISHLELMRRLQHSQNDLSRMGSVQSDSSGFGDADPVLVESAFPESDHVKQLASLGSSNESSRTLASSAVTAVLCQQHKEEMATQTSLDSGGVEVSSCRVKTSRDITAEARPDSDSVKQSSRLDDDNQRYVTMCYIPTLSSRFGQPHGPQHRASPHDEVDHRGSHHSGADVAVSAQRARSGSVPQQTCVPHSADHDYARPRLNTTSGSEFHRPAASAAHIRYNSRGFHQSDNLHETGWRRDGQGFHQNTSPRETSDSGYVQGHTEKTEYNVYRHRDIGEQRRDASSSWHTRSPDQRSERDVSRSGKKFTSQIDLYSGAAGFSRKHVSSTHPASASPRRHSDEGILEGRNTTPLSVELAFASGSGIKAVASPHSPYISAAPTTTSATAFKTATVQRISSYTTSRSSGSDIQDNVAVETPAHYKTEAGFHFPTLAGNIGGLRPVSVRPVSVRSQTFHSPSRQRSCDILDDDFEDRCPLTASLHSRMSEDLDLCSPVTDNISDISMQSLPEVGTKSGLLDARKLARLINQPIHFMGRRRGSQYRRSHQFQDWSLLSKRKRLQEETQLLQKAVQKYKTELTIMEASFMMDYQITYPEMTDQEREEAQELEWLWSQVKGEVMDMEHLLMTRVKALHGDLELYNLLSSLGVIQKTVELVKEQICQQQLASSDWDQGRDRSLDNDLDMLDEIISCGSKPRLSQSWVGDVGHVSTPRAGRRFHSSSASNLSHDFNISLEQIKSSVLSEVKHEILESTKKLEHDLQEKDREIKHLQQQLGSTALQTPDPQPRRWSPRSSAPRSCRVSSSSKSTRVGEKTSQETDV